MPKKKPEPKTRLLAVYNRDYQTFSQIARDTDRSLVLMFQHMMNQIREGKPVAFVVESENGKAAR